MPMSAYERCKHRQGGGAALSAPFLARSVGRRATAQPTAAPVRFLAVRTPHGVDRDYWIPRHADGAEESALELIKALPAAKRALGWGRNRPAKAARARANRAPAKDPRANRKTTSIVRLVTP